MDQSAIEELFERNADMRLLEFRHNENGKGPQPAKKTGPSFSAESIVSSMPDVALEKTPALRVAIAAAPKAGVIPGAVVGIAIDVFNDGTAPAPESKLLISLPIESEYRSGSLRVDGREVAAPEQLFAAGLPIARLPGGTSSKVTFQLAVLPGINALYLQPRLQTDGVPVVGTAGVTVKRGANVATIAAVPEPETPFYELDEEETADELAASAAPELPPVLAPEPEPEPVAEVAPAPPAEPEPGPEPQPMLALKLEPAIEVPARAPEPPPAAAPEPEPAPVASLEPVAAVAPEAPAAPEPAAAPKAPPKPRAKTAPAGPPKAAPAAAPAEERMLRYRTLAPSDVALLERLFSVDAPGMIAHFVLISSIACSEPPSGEDASGYAAFLRRDIELLGRALVHSRMGKAPQYRIAQSDLDALQLPWETPAQAQPFPPPRRLRRELRKPEWTAIRGLTQPSERDATLRTRIALLALAAASVEGVDRKRGDECDAALGGYRSTALAWLVPLCVASAGADGFVIPPPPAAVDAAGRKLVAAIKTTLGA